MYDLYQLTRGGVHDLDVLDLGFFQSQGIAREDEEGMRMRGVI